jgi:hypothetical protein
MEFCRSQNFSSNNRKTSIAPPRQVFTARNFAKSKTPQAQPQIVNYSAHGMSSQHGICQNQNFPSNYRKSLIVPSTACIHRTEFYQRRNFPSNYRKSSLAPPRHIYTAWNFAEVKTSQAITANRHIHRHGIYSPHEILPKSKLPKQLSQNVNRAATACIHRMEFCQRQNFPSNSRKSSIAPYRDYVRRKNAKNKTAMRVPGGFIAFGKSKNRGIPHGKRCLFPNMSEFWNGFRSGGLKMDSFS